MAHLQTLALHGFRSIQSLGSLRLTPLNVLIGSNGAGKSNLLSFFRMLQRMMSAPGELQFYVGQQGGASRLLHDGAASTGDIEACLRFELGTQFAEYHLRLAHAASDTLVFAEERYRLSSAGQLEEAPWTALGAGHRESALLARAEQGDATAQELRHLIQRCSVYQFHNTSESARIRQKWGVDDGRPFREDAANLAPLLLRLQQSHPPHHRRIVGTLRFALPFFADFVLEPESRFLLLRWRERGSDVVFDAHQASDGMLRLMALVSLLLQPEEDLPGLLLLDEPELGLHPYAIAMVAGLLKSASLHTQVAVATQSETLLNHFEPEDLVIVDREERSSRFRRLVAEELDEWLQEYSLGELWGKNVIGGRPG